MTRSSPMSAVDDRDVARSPSLRATAERGAYEWKFLLEPELAERIEAWAARELSPDPHGAAATPGRYQTTTLYLDTPALDLFHRRNGFGDRKLRLRRYDAGTTLHLERKVRRGEEVSKTRGVVADGVALLAAGGGLVALAAATVDPTARDFVAGFAAEVAAAGLAPSCRLTYDRTAYFAHNEDGAHRLTLDRAIRGERTGAWQVEPVPAGASLLGHAVILELKFVGAPPTRFKSLLADYRLAPSGVSKYRRFLGAALGLRSDRDDGGRRDDDLVRSDRR